MFLRALTILCVAGALAGCRHFTDREGTVDHTGPPLINSPDLLAQGLNRHVVVEGRAGNAKLGAVVSVGELPVYVDGLRRWREAAADRPVRVRGTLIRRHDKPGGTDNVSAGRWDPYYLLLEPDSPEVTMSREAEKQ